VHLEDCDRNEDGNEKAAKTDDPDFLNHVIEDRLHYFYDSEALEWWLWLNLTLLAYLRKFNLT
jgi:hypothetical protein